LHPMQKACVIFNKLVVNNIEDSSGIFIGTNQAIAWSSYSKSNQGFGSLHDSTLSQSLNVVYDPDLIDASVEDIRNITLSEFPNNQQLCAIDFQSINANALSNGSAIDLGDNKQLGWRSSRKVNYGGGKHLGANRVNQVANIIVDNDVVDAPFHTDGQIVDSLPSVKNIRITQKGGESDND
jgi:hypothetical protein